jgi:hypothetical protein
MERPMLNERETEKMTFQMMYQRYVSRKNMMRSITYMIASVNSTWREQSTVPKNGSWQLTTRFRAMTATGLLNEEVRKKYDSTNLQPKTSVQSPIDATRALRVNSGYEAVKVCEAMYLRDLPATRSPNIRPDGMMENAMVAATDRPNWTTATISGIDDFVLPSTMTM